MMTGHCVECHRYNAASRERSSVFATFVFARLPRPQVRLSCLAYSNLRVRALRHREGDTEAGPAPARSFHSYFAAHLLADLTTDSKAQPGFAVAPNSCRGGCVWT
jgi:hypothetical protein